MFGSSSNTLDHGMDDFEQQLQELFTEVKVMLSKGNKNDARNLLQANYEAVKERIDKGVSGIQEAAILDIIALGYIAMGDFKLVRSILKRVTPAVLLVLIIFICFFIFLHFYFSFSFYFLVICYFIYLLFILVVVL